MEEKKIENVTQGAGTAGGSWYDSLGNKPKDAAYINKMYDGSLESQKQTLTQNYDTGVSDIAASAEKQRKATDANLNRTYVESAKAAKNYGEVQNAYGLTSGAMAQARLAQDNQLQADLTALRAAQTDSDAQFERQRNLLAKEYSAAIAKAQADNDYQRAQALYNAAKADEDQLMQMQKEAGNLMAGVGDYSILAKLYGLTDEQLALLNRKYGGGGSGGGGGGSYRRSGGSPGGTDAGLTAEEILALMYGEDGAGTTGGTGASTGGIVGANDSILSLGKGPISGDTLAGLVNSGEVTVGRARDGSVRYYTTPSTSKIDTTPAPWVPRKNDRNGKGRNGGGSSVHIFSDGPYVRIHGGGGGKF